MAGATEDRTVSPDATPTAAIKNWMGQKIIAGFVWEEVKQINFERRNDVRHTKPVMNKRGEILLGILTYAYATGLYRSREIESELMRSPAAQQFFANAPITDTSLRRFRRCNCELVKHCLRNVLCRALRAQGIKADASGAEVNDEGLPATISAVMCVPLATAESEQRLAEVAIHDSTELD